MVTVVMVKHLQYPDHLSIMLAVAAEDRGIIL
jgi:hypothetical protein